MVGGFNVTIGDNCTSCPLSEEDIWAKLILEEISIPVVGSVGLVGNLAAMVVLSHPDMKSTFHQSLITLAVFEIMFLVLVICDHAVNIQSQVYVVMFPYFLYPLKNILMTCESYLLMSIALERLMAVARPLWYRQARLRLSGWWHAAVFILPTVVLSVSLNIPKFFELELVFTNVTDTANEVIQVRDFEPTPLRLDPDYILYYIHWTRSLGTGVLPILFLLVTNFSIYLSLRRQRVSSPSISASSESHDSAVTLASPRKFSVFSTRKFSVFSDLVRSSNEARDMNIFMLTEEQIHHNSRAMAHSAVTLTAIVMMYIVCNIPRLVLNLAEYLYQSQLYQDYDLCSCVRNKVWIEVTIRLNHLLLTVNSSANFIIYWSVGKKFKSTLVWQATAILARIKGCFHCNETRDEGVETGKETDRISSNQPH